MTQLTTNPAEDVMPAWSADDKDIIFTSSRDTYKTLWAVNVATKAERKIAELEWQYRGRIDGSGWPAGL